MPERVEPAHIIDSYEHRRLGVTRAQIFRRPRECRARILIMSPASVDTSIETGPDGSVYAITVKHPARLNVLNSTLIDALRTALDAVAADDTARIAVLRGAGERAWIGGADINEMAQLDVEGARTFITRLHTLCVALRKLPVPVIAAIDGYCLGAGLEVAAACDIRVATHRSTFGMPEVLVGIPSVIDAALLPAIIGVGASRELVLTGRSIDAHEALRISLVTAIAESGDAFETALADRIDAIVHAAPIAVRTQKQLCQTWEDDGYAEAIATSIDRFAASFATPEPAQRMRSFLNRKRDT